MKGDDLLENFYQAINITMRPRKRKKIIKNVFNRETKTNWEYIYKDTPGNYVKMV
jgi:hypothetical protein